MAPQTDLHLRYPSAQDLPATSPSVGAAARQKGSSGATAHMSPENLRPTEDASRGVCIDRKVFRPLRRRPRRADSTPAPLGPQAADIENQMPIPASPAHGEHPGVSDADADFAEYGEGYQLDDGQGDDHMDILGLDGMLRDPWLGAHNMMRPGTAPARAGMGVGAADLGPWSSPPSRYATPPNWTPSPKRRAPRSDPVSRGAQMRDLWSRDRFLRNSGSRKFDLRGCGGNGSVHAQGRNLPPQLLMTTYVPPHEKRRDSVRMHMRQQMLVPDMA